ncbi:DNA-directed RNA polymerase subunit delta [Bacillus sp. FJAT-27225]|uniref:DNA-directed RNA polymerase subunit delta n=1 Tax=Bacillus sp. FJAT-27225 TaxID=1743144 RepID=UPI00080C25BA|nr:DNA-directed RNA polymerase subunit delta [Bacillus sp. FJAT-27225]OCA82469.1 DNA-directed RNA polymerase subunit delta [Bacillus sp. FJAT-27225]
MSLENYSKEQLKEMSMIEMAYELLKNKKQTLAFNEIIDEIAKASDLSKDQVRSRIAQFYTDLNIDGRFISLGENKWGLRVWYPVDTVEEEQVHAAKPKKKKAKKVLDDDLDDYEELEDEAEFDDFAEDDILDEDEDSFDDIEEADEFEEDEEEFDIDDEEEIDEDLDEDIEEDLDDDLEESLEALEEEELADDEDEEEDL